MKTRTIITSILFMFAANCYSQITSITPKETEKIKYVLKYDSLESLNYENAQLHNGQTLFIKGSCYSKSNGFPYTFYSKIITDSLRKDYIYNQNILDFNLDDYIFKPTQISTNHSVFGKRIEIVSEYSALIGKYYKIASVYIEKSRLGDNIYWIGLVDENNTSFYLYFDKYKSKDIFVTLGYYEKMKKTFVGKEFYSKGRYDIENIDTKEKIILPYKVKFKCTDIAVNVGEDGPIFAVLENEKYGRMKGEIMEGVRLNHFIDVIRYNEFIKKYGAKFGSYVAEGRIEIGMNKKMVLDAWGSPSDVNTTTGSFGVHEQWVYDDRYLYFKNGVLTSTQL